MTGSCRHTPPRDLITIAPMPRVAAEDEPMPLRNSSGTGMRQYRDIGIAEAALHQGSKTQGHPFSFVAPSSGLQLREIFAAAGQHGGQCAGVQKCAPGPAGRSNATRESSAWRISKKWLHVCSIMRRQLACNASPWVRSSTDSRRDCEIETDSERLLLVAASAINRQCDPEASPSP